ncbi:hypothetical protein ASE74_23460 [Pedobacter sp. Leaf216]|uniref:hypothetical protein n=1 Tax=Pedobacter sp. Leaf216 TaxID=1735684 RepID=UPI0006FE8A52|nr:hypothetical protein [Pedobacter sp. Leaf216]KQM71457.1 hypothetical protein ASE74_23460 [Pedobacter sp. Leaf216]
MNKLISAEKLLFECLMELSCKDGHEQLEVSSAINEAVLCAMHRHTEQFLLPLSKLLKKFSKLKLMKSNSTIKELERFRKKIKSYLGDKDPKEQKAE